MKRLLFIPLLVASLNALAEDKTTTLDQYKFETSGKHLLCSIKYKNTLMAAELGQPSDTGNNITDCINGAKADTKPLLNQSLKRLKNLKAKEALKNYHVAFIGAIEGIPAGHEEITIDYNRRQQMLSDKMREAWARFEIEQ